MSDAEQRKQIVMHFEKAAVRRKPLPKEVLDSLHASWEGALAETVQENEIEFVEARGPAPDDEDDFGSVLILAGGHLYAIEASRTQIKVSVVGDLSGGSYSEASELEDGEVIETTILYEHPRLEDGAIVLTFPPRDAERYRPIRTRLRVWGGRTLASPSSATRPDPI
jgi:hypothetical protein